MMPWSPAAAVHIGSSTAWSENGMNFRTEPFSPRATAGRASVAAEATKNSRRLMVPPCRPGRRYERIDKPISGAVLDYHLPVAGIRLFNPDADVANDPPHALLAAEVLLGCHWSRCSNVFRAPEYWWLYALLL